MKGNPTLRELAAIAGVSHQTVALALRDSPRITKGTRERLQLLAKDAGYRRKPNVSAWAAYVRTKKTVLERTKLGFIGPLPPDDAGQYKFYTEFHRGAVAEAESLGYGLHFFGLSDLR